MATSLAERISLCWFCITFTVCQSSCSGLPSLHSHLDTSMTSMSLCAVCPSTYSFKVCFAVQSWCRILEWLDKMIQSVLPYPLHWWRQPLDANVLLWTVYVNKQPPTHHTYLNHRNMYLLLALPPLLTECSYVINIGSSWKRRKPTWCAVKVIRHCRM